MQLSFDGDEIVHDVCSGTNRQKGNKVKGTRRTACIAATLMFRRRQLP